MSPQIPSSEILLYQSEDGKSRVQVILDGETVWLTQRLLAELYQVGVGTINYHIKSIYKDQELSPGATIRQYRIVRSEGGRSVERFVAHYNLDMILTVGYRVRSLRGTQFRQWATEHLREYLVKGFVMDDQRLKEGKTLGADYFDVLLERIRDIRASEKRFYQKIKDIYKLAIDYDPGAETTQEFFQIVQNKLHFSVTGKTAAEIIAERADAEKPNMGLTAWSGARLRKHDVTIAKNYLNEPEIKGLNRIVTMYLDYAEEQAASRKPLYMKDWRERLDAFLRFNQKKILQKAGTISMEIARELALDQYEKFNRGRLAEEALAPDQDFDKLAKRVEGKRGKGTKK
ncbi:MAG TPA: virulence RhuM family protein [bacterium]|nr:virulence RhuM family protein [bacterium]